MLYNIVAESLEKVAEAVGDPVPAVYGRLFEQYPEMKALFVLDTTGGARGHMLAEAIDCVLDFCDGNNYASNFIDAERMNHDGLGVPPDVFSSFLSIVVEAFREILGSGWTEDIDQAWSEVLTGLDASEPVAS